MIWPSSKEYILVIFPFVAPTVAPVNVTVTVLNSSSVSLHWIKPDKNVLHGVLKRYEIDYKRLECNETDPVSVTNNSWVTVQVANTSLSEVVSGLVFWSCYEFRMRAVTVGDGPFSNLKKVRTSQHGEFLFA